MGRCRSDCSSVTECLCSVVDSFSIDFSGSGSSASPFKADSRLDASTNVVATLDGNQVVITSFGLLVPTLPYVKVFDDTGQIRADAEPIIWDAERRDLWGMHSANSPYVTLSEDGWWGLHTRIGTEDNASLTDIIVRIRDYDTRDIIGQSNSTRTVDGLTHEVTEEEWLPAGMKICSTIDFVGTASITIQGGGSYGHRTNLVCRKLAKI